MYSTVSCGLPAWPPVFLITFCAPSVATPSTSSVHSVQPIVDRTNRMSAPPLMAVSDDFLTEGRECQLRPQYRGRILDVEHRVHLDQIEREQQGRIGDDFHHHV